MIYLKCQKKKKNNLEPRVLYLARLSFRIEGEIKSFPEKQKQRDFITIKFILLEM